MTDPIVFISHSRVKEGMLGALEEFTREMFPVLEAEKPGTLLHVGYVDDDGTKERISVKSGDALPRTR